MLPVQVPSAQSCQSSQFPGPVTPPTPLQPTACHSAPGRHQQGTQSSERAPNVPALGHLISSSLCRRAPGSGTSRPLRLGARHHDAPGRPGAGAPPPGRPARCRPSAWGERLPCPGGGVTSRENVSFLCRPQWQMDQTWWVFSKCSLSN